MIAVIYSSLNGTSKKYAELLGRRIYLPIYSLEKSKIYLEKKDEIVYVGWIKNGKIVGLKKARRMYTVRAVCAVGMEYFSDENYRKIVNVNKLGNVPLYYLQGGIYMDKIKGMNRLLIKNKVKNEILRLESIENKTSIDEALLNMYREGADFVSEVNLSLAISECSKIKPL